MPRLTDWGGVFGYPPFHLGRTYYIAPAADYTVNGNSYRASNDNSGLKPTEAIRDINRFVALATADVGDLAILLPGTHTVTATQVIDKAGLTILGVPETYFGAAPGFHAIRTTLTIRDTADELLDIRSSNTKIGFLRLQAAVDQSTISFQTTAALDGLHFFHLWIDMGVNGAYNIRTRGIDFGNRAGGNTFARQGTVARNPATAFLENIYFETAGAAGAALHIASASVKARNLHFHNTAGTWASPLIVATAYDNCTIEDSLWSTSGTMTVAMSGPTLQNATTVADGILVTNCRITNNLGTAATAFDGFGPDGMSIAENYVCGQPAVSQQNGGALITMIT
jgi:hypothetical protein